MAMITHNNPSLPRGAGDTGERTAARMPFYAQVIMLARRALVVNLRAPAAIVPPLGITLLTLFIYKAQLGSIAAASFLSGGSYIGFILPLSVLTAVLSGSALAGQTILGDIERGYFDKLTLAPASRWALLLGPMLAGGAVLLVQTVVLVGVGLLIGLQPETGVVGLLAMLGLSLLVGVGFSGVGVGVALLTGSSAATASTNFLFFPLTLLTAAFAPIDQLEGWLQVVARLNPMTYVLEAMRSLLNAGWDETLLLRGLASGAGLFVVLVAFALYALGTRTRRR